MEQTMGYTKVTFSGTPEQVNEQWHEARKNGIGGSDVAALMGLNKYKSPLSLWLEKTGRAESPDLSGNDAIFWGNALEPVIADRFQQEHPDWTVKEPNAMFVSKERPWAFANLDRIVIDDQMKESVLEIKTVGFRRASDWDNGVPLYYQTQVIHYMSVTGMKRAYVAVLIGGQEYREYVLEPDSDDVAAVRSAVDGFWRDYVEADAMPALVGTDDEGGALLELYSRPEADMANVSPEEEFDDWVSEIESANARIKELQAHVDLLKNKVKQRIGNHDGAVSDVYQVKWSRGESTKFDAKRFKKENPELAQEYTATCNRDGGIKIKELI